MYRVMPIIKRTIIETCHPMKAVSSKSVA
jgi:hypothetical protein